MTRLLSELLGAREPNFRLDIQKLEAVNGHPSADIRLSNEVLQATKAKLAALGLDPKDTTAHELYGVLLERVKSDDTKLEKALRTRAATYVSAEGDVIAGIVHALKEASIPKSCFALKTAVLKSLLKKQPPKRAMRQIGYRSLDSMLKHEPAINLLAAAWLSESAAWRRNLLDQYKKLKASDFEPRQIQIVTPDSKHWQALAQSVVSREHHNILSFKELGAIIILPLPAERPAALTTVTLTLALHALNEIRASSTFLKLCQVRNDFGTIVQTVVTAEPLLNTNLLDQPVPWQLIQSYYARLSQRFREELFEPHIELQDFSWAAVEETLSQIEPSLEFWHHTGHLSWLHRSQPVSFNIIDAALNYCNKLPFEKRIVHYFRHSLWHELMLRYLKHETVEQAVAAELQPELAEQEVAV
ncbi:MAG TPA: hypothetical protein VLG37_02845 [Candidatus Saccharimonadales bacterium]|nr:hypothetical protein [Candidatus Saccharimonadales bacterium]